MRRGGRIPIFWQQLPWSYASFPVFPRRSRLLECTLYPYDAPETPAHLSLMSPSLIRFMGIFPSGSPNLSRR